MNTPAHKKIYTGLLFTAACVSANASQGIGMELSLYLLPCFYIVGDGFNDLRNAG